MKIADARKMLAKTLTVAFLAGVAFLATSQKVQAQEGYYGGGFSQNDYARHEFFERERAEQFRRQQEFERHQAWLREREFRHEQHEWRKHHRFDRDGFERRY